MRTSRAPHAARSSVVLPLLALGAVASLQAACWRRSSPSPEGSPASSASALASVSREPAPPPPGAGLGTSSSAQPLVALPSGMTAPLSFSKLIKASDPAVVTVFAWQVDRRGGRRRSSESLGTGFLYDPSGYILTNNHVIADATEVVVRVADERRLTAKVVGRDPPTDVAVLKVEVSNAPFLPLGDSTALEVGDWVVAIGNPFGLSHTVSAGIVSAKGRTREDVRDLDQTGKGYFNFLQTDAAINQGNSGGPLINLRGEVVGINTAIRANANSIGFAIPINMVKALLPMLVSEGRVRRSALGIRVVGLSEDHLARLKRASRRGALVEGVQPDSGAARAGIAPDDVIVAFNGQPIAEPEDLRWQASIAGIGSTAVVTVARGDRTIDFKVQLGALPDDNDPPATHGHGAP